MSTLEWWKQAVFYQIYPRSFADGNGDGIGDLKGIIEKLDYLQDLGVDALWLSPHYPSPQFDCGCDIADYTNIEPEYGTLEEFKQFLDEAHKRNLRVILDLVLNHTSDQHPWFRESKSSRDNPKRDGYLWRDGIEGGPPNDWSAAFDSCGWTYDPATDQRYYHFFFAEQPDMIKGDYGALYEESETVLAFLRQTETQRCWVVLNYSDQAQSLSFDRESADGTLIFSSANLQAEVDLVAVEVAPFEILLVELAG